MANFCSNCGSPLPPNANACPVCGHPCSDLYQNNNYQQQYYDDTSYRNQPLYAQPGTRQPDYGPQYVVIHESIPRSNRPGNVGFVLGLLGMILCWIPVVGGILLLLGFIFSMIGVFRVPKGKAIAGLVLSAVGIFTLIILYSFSMELLSAIFY